MSKKKRYHLLIFSNHVDEKCEEFEKWYAGQHIHDICAIPGVVGGHLYKLHTIQLNPETEQKYQYVMNWEIETDNLDGVVDEMNKHAESGETVLTGTMAPGYMDMLVMPITRYVDADSISGKSVEEVLDYSMLKKL